MQDIDDVLLCKHCKEGASVVTHFWVPTKKWENTKKYINIKKIFRRNPKNNRSEKKMLECQKNAKISWGDSKMQKVKIWQYIFTDESPGDKENSILRKKSPISDVYGLN